MAKHNEPTWRRLASWALSDLYQLAAVHRAHGEVLLPDAWLKVLANVLSSAPAGIIGKRRDRHAPEYFGLTYTNLLIAAERCGLEATADTIEQQVAETLEWRKRESERIGKPHYFMMRPDVIGKMLGVTDETRMEAKAWNIGVFGGSPEQRRRAKQERDRLRKLHARRAAGAIGRREYEASSLTRQKPWEAEGTSRTTWYLRTRENSKEKGNGSGSHNRNGEPDGAKTTTKKRDQKTEGCKVRKTGQVRPRTSAARPIREKSDRSGATNSTYTQPDAVTSFAEPSKTRGDTSYTPKPGGIAARLFAMVRKPSRQRPASAAHEPGVGGREKKGATEAVRPPIGERALSS